MPKQLIVSTKFTAIDKFSRVVNRMTRSVHSMAARAQMGFARVQRAERKMRKSISQKVGKLGLYVGLSSLLLLFGNSIKVFADFEQANASLAAVMNTTTQANKDLAIDAKRLGATTAKTAAEVVGLQEAFARLGFEKTAILNMTEATISGSIAMKSELSDTAELVGAMVKSFDSFSSIDAPDIIDKLTLSTQKSALNFEKLQTALPTVAGAANAAGIPFTKLLALLGKLSDAGIDASSSATSLRNIFLDSKKRGHSYEQILKNIYENQDKLTASYDEFGRRGSISGVVLAQNLEGIDKLDVALQNAGGTAQKAADKQLNTLTGRMTILKSAWEGYVLSLDDGTGKFSNFLKTAVEVATEILSIASGTEKAKNSLDAAGLKIRQTAQTVLKFIKIIKWLGIAFVTFKSVMFLTRIGLIAYNVAIGITGALSGAASIAIGESQIALAAYSVTSKLAAASQWLLNAAMTANPIGIIIVSIGVLIALVAAIIINWDTWGKTIVKYMGPLGSIIEAVMMFGQEWAGIQEAFKSEGILGGLKRIGQAVIRLLIIPLKQAGEVLEAIGILDAGTMQNLINSVGLGDDNVTQGKDYKKEKVNADATVGRGITRTNVNNSTLDIKNNTGMSAILKGTNPDISLSNTLNFAQ